MTLGIVVASAEFQVSLEHQGFGSMVARSLCRRNAPRLVQGFSPMNGRSMTRKVAIAQVTVAAAAATIASQSSNGPSVAYRDIPTIHRLTAHIRKPWMR